MFRERGLWVVELEHWWANEEEMVGGRKISDGYMPGIISSEEKVTGRRRRRSQDKTKNKRKER